MLAAEIQRDGARQIGIRPDHQEADQAHQNCGQCVPAARAQRAEREQRERAQQQAVEHDGRAPAAAQAIAPKTREEHGNAAEQRENRAHSGRLSLTIAHHLVKVSRRPSIKGLAHQRGAQRQRAHCPECRAAEQRREQIAQARRSRIASLRAEQVQRIHLRLREADLRARFL